MARNAELSCTHFAGVAEGRVGCRTSHRQSTRDRCACEMRMRSAEAGQEVAPVRRVCCRDNALLMQVSGTHCEDCTEVEACAAAAPFLRGGGAWDV